MNSKIDLNALLQIASERLGMTPEDLKSNIESENAESFSNRIRPADLGKLKEILANPEKASQILSSPQAKLLMSLFKKHKS